MPEDDIDIDAALEDLTERIVGYLDVLVRMRRSLPALNSALQENHERLHRLRE